ncbi:hypothetical protein DI383_06865 [Flavobacteriaceae bacterium LYZ1037]|nr:hypothetical protein DI383_06865 [Flavobacteriaceae bacterium LYZ1037]
MGVTQISNQDIVQDMDDSKHEMNNHLEGDFTFIVTEITDSSYVINFKFNRFKLVTTSNIYGELINIDTKNSVIDDNLEAKIFSGLTKSTLQMDMLKTGEIIKISGTEAMINKMITDAGITDEFTKELMVEAMKKEFGNESLARSFEQLTFIYPTKKVMTGDSWINHYSGDLNAENNWTLINWDKNIELTAKSIVTMITEEDSHIMSLKGTQNTHVIANKKTGFAELITVTSNTTGSTVMKQMNDVKIPTTIKSKSTYKIKKHVQ